MLGALRMRLARSRFVRLVLLFVPVRFRDGCRERDGATVGPRRGRRDIERPDLYPLGVQELPLIARSRARRSDYASGI